MGKLTLYKSIKEHVCGEWEFSAEVRTFLEYATDNFTKSCYVEDKDNLSSMFGDDEQSEFEIVADWFEKNNLYEMDLDLEY